MPHTPEHTDNQEGYNTLFSSYVSGGGYGGYSGFDVSDFSEEYSDEALQGKWEEFETWDWGTDDVPEWATEYTGSEFYESELDAYGQLGDLYQGFQADIFGSRSKLAKDTRKYDLTSGRTGLISGKRMAGRENILTSSADEQQSLFSSYLSERTGLAGTIDQAREDYWESIDEAMEV